MVVGPDKVLSCMLVHNRSSIEQNCLRKCGKQGGGFGEDGEEWDESVNGFGCDFYEECCGEGCVYGEIGQEECF